MASRSSPCTRSRFLTKKGSGRSSSKNASTSSSRSARARRSGLVDPGGVGDAERDDAERAVGAGAGVLEHELDDPVDLGGRRLDGLLALGDHAVPVDEHVVHDRVGAGAGEGDERPLVDLGVGEGDEPLVERAVVPRQAAARQRGGEHVEDRLEPLGERLVGADRGGVAVGDGGEERRSAAAGARRRRRRPGGRARSPRPPRPAGSARPRRRRRRRTTAPGGSTEATTSGLITQHGRTAVSRSGQRGTRSRSGASRRARAPSARRSVSCSGWSRQHLGDVVAHRARAPARRWPRRRPGRPRRTPRRCGSAPGRRGPPPAGRAARSPPTSEDHQTHSTSGVDLLGRHGARRGRRRAVAARMP